MKADPTARCRSFASMTGIKPALVAALWAFTPSVQAQTLYDFGDPNGNEQLYVELINRARANPSAEGARLAASTEFSVVSAYSQYHVDLALMQNEFNALPTLPPLAPNAKLTTTSRSHSAWMLANAIQSHNETNPFNTPWDRVIAAGYDYTSMGESAYAYYSSVSQGHAGFQVDWGADDLGSTGGMQARRGHRANNHSAVYREIGVGVVSGRNGEVGPQLVTMDFGYRASEPSFGTGVAYYDLNGNGFYDSGEGISGLTVNVEGASYYCTTANGGGWVVPVPNTAATRAVTFSGPGVNYSTNVDFPDSNNAKADLKLTYSRPTITSSSDAATGSPHTVEFTQTPGASSYRWSRWLMETAATETCESTGNITTSTTDGYQVLNSSVKQQGSSSFHLVNKSAVEQSLELNSLFYAQSSASVTFQSQVRTASLGEFFKVQIKEETGTASWQDVYSQSGTNSSGENSFNARTVDLTSMNGKAFRIRFIIDPGDLTHYSSTDNSYGWFIDSIAFTNIKSLASPAVESLATTSGIFTPSSGTYLMAIAPMISGTDFPAAYQVLTTPLNFQVECPENTVLQDGSTTLVFGNSDTGTPVTKTITVRNTGAGDVTGLAVARSGTNATDFSLGTLGATTLASGATTTFTVTFTPAAAGTRSATLQISSSETGGNPIDIALTGTGVAVDPYQLCFVGTPYDLRVGNQVTFNLNNLITAGETLKVGGKIPTGLKFNAATGLLTGILAGKAGTYQTTVQIYQGKTLARTVTLPITLQDFPSSLIGGFDCILEDADSIPSGAFRLTIAKPNQWTATLEAAGAAKIRKATGTFILGEGSPVAPITASFAADTTAPAVTVTISIDGSSLQQTGTYTNGTLRGFRLAGTGQYPPATVACNLVLDAGAQDGITVPAGIGWMKGPVSNKGIGTFKGALGDGTAASFALKVSPYGQAVLWSQPYKNKSSFIGGIVTIANLGQATPAGPLTDDEVWWKKSAEAGALSYPDGFPAMEVDVGSSRWTPAATATILGDSLGWRDSRTAEVTMDGAGLSNADPQTSSAPLPTEFTIDDKFNLVTSAPTIPAPVVWKGLVTKADGGFSGTLTLPSGFSTAIPAGGVATASGVLVQDDSWGATTGCGLIKIPTSGPAGSFRTAALVIGQ